MLEPLDLAHRADARRFALQRRHLALRIGRPRDRARRAAREQRRRSGEEERAPVHSASASASTLASISVASASRPARRALLLRGEPFLLLDQHVEQIGHQQRGIGLVGPAAPDLRQLPTAVFDDQRLRLGRVGAQRLRRRDNAAHEGDDALALLGIGEVGGGGVEPEDLAIDALAAELDRILADRENRVRAIRLPDRDGIGAPFGERPGHVGEHRHRHEGDVGLAQPHGPQHPAEEVAGGGGRDRRDALALQVGERRDPRRAACDDAVEALGDGEDDAQVGVLERIAQRLRLGMGGDIGMARRAVARDRRLAEEIGDAAHPDRRGAGIVPLGGEQHRRDLEGLDVAVDRDRRQRGLDARLGRAAGGDHARRQQRQQTAETADKPLNAHPSRPPRGAYAYRQFCPMGLTAPTGGGKSIAAHCLAGKTLLPVRSTGTPAVHALDARRGGYPPGRNEISPSSDIGPTGPQFTPASRYSVGLSPKRSRKQRANWALLWKPQQ